MASKPERRMGRIYTISSFLKIVVCDANNTSLHDMTAIFFQKRAIWMIF
jgi:hypothetical protein